MTQVPEFIEILNAHANNLKNVDVKIPKFQFITVTGLSGSGKSSLVFEILHKEGQRQYMESLGLATDTLSKAPVDRIKGLSPTISVEQVKTHNNPRSTVGTVTEIYTYLRILFARLGERACPHCGERFAPLLVKKSPYGHMICPQCNGSADELSMAHFSFNKLEGACPHCTGLGETLEADPFLLIDHTKSIRDIAVHGWDIHYVNRNVKTLMAAGEYFGCGFDVDIPVSMLTDVQKDLLYYGVESDRFLAHYPGIEAPKTASTGRFEGVLTNLLRRYREQTNVQSREKLGRFLSKQICPQCEGKRLKKESLDIKILGADIHHCSQLSLQSLQQWVNSLDEQFTIQYKKVARPILDDLQIRIAKYVDIGLHYLTMERTTLSLSGGEFQRLRLAALLQSELSGIIYILDEPSTGLHSRDTERLIRFIKGLRDLGNTVIVIEHDPDIIRSADFLIDIGPGAGEMGGMIIAQGSIEEVQSKKDNLTVASMVNKNFITHVSKPHPGNRRALTIQGARAHNLKGWDVSFPLGCFNVVSGVSGSGKSSLVMDIIKNAGEAYFQNKSAGQTYYNTIEGWSHLDDIISVDQKPIGKSTRSNPASYIDMFGDIRKVFATLDRAKKLGLKPSDFSFNTDGGRCPHCKGQGTITINMHFLPDVETVCPHCQGKRYLSHILDVTYKDHSIYDVLELSVSKAIKLFDNIGVIKKKLDLLEKVGLSYIKLGQHSSSFSGGEAQRIKLSKELSRSSKGNTLYILDEPSNGLHPQDVKHLLGLMHALVSQGNTLLVVEHNLDIIKNADFILDLGPEGGDNGGEIIAQGSLKDIVACPQSYTGSLLKELL